MINELVGYVFQARDVAHLHHFKTEIYAEHMALDEFYHDVIEAVDKLVESYQGRFTLIAPVHFCVSDELESTVIYFGNQLRWIEKYRDQITKGNKTLENILDELVGVYTKLLYKLRFLK